MSEWLAVAGMVGDRLTATKPPQKLVAVSWARTVQAEQTQAGQLQGPAGMPRGVRVEGMQVGGMGLDGRGRQLPDHMHIRPGCGLHSRSGGGEADGLAKTVPRQDGICL